MKRLFEPWNRPKPRYIHYRCLKDHFGTDEVEERTILAWGTYGSRCCVCGEFITKKDDGNGLGLFSRLNRS